MPSKYGKALPHFKFLKEELCEGAPLPVGYRVVESADNLRFWWVYDHRGMYVQGEHDRPSHKEAVQDLIDYLKE